MKRAAAASSSVCIRSLSPLPLRRTSSSTPRSTLAESQPTRRDGDGDGDGNRDPSGVAQEEQVKVSVEQGAMSRRLTEMAEQSLEDNPRRAHKTAEEAGFSDELKRQLEERLLDSKFREDNVAAFTQADLPASAGRATRDIAAAQPWTGTEQDQDSVLRMLVDAHKPFKGNRSTDPRRAIEVKVGRKRPSSGQRLVDARDRSSTYSLSKDDNLSEQERAQIKQELKDRFLPGARPMPASLQGLASLANEKIEDAISRGQFKDLPRGKPLERDYNASSPFLNTTEYFMNKIIQKQDIVPPWIEKQQELTRAVEVFRGRLKNDWKRHAARVISSKGGTLQEQIKTAEKYAAAERQAATSQPPIPRLKRGSIESLATSELEEPGNTNPSPSELLSPSSPPAPIPFRDPTWEQTERSYHTLAIHNLNNLARTYNLLAPTLAKKPYFSLDRELRSCFAETAPQLADEIRERARSPLKPTASGDGGGGVVGSLAAFGAGETRESARVYESQRPHYGFKELVRDWWRGQGG
ncbi:hypothetical protein FGG08_006983 [Glutinoglossum americanum]|uniref:DnaJ homologue subfamily C member 28 conserved domain-containing protein n=1 Tax=Glutinoglossum americanum TaxID=1670608 RepID=A0A9P8L1D8_9PEZI|nr:hypothetical protein FGG08_006983 [Glutinoglossum americanum]